MTSPFLAMAQERDYWCKYTDELCAKHGEQSNRCRAQRSLWETRCEFTDTDSTKANSGTAARASADMERVLTKQSELTRQIEQDHRALLERNSCATAIDLCRGNPKMCSDARRLISDSGLSCPGFEAVERAAAAEIPSKAYPSPLTARSAEPETLLSRSPPIDSRSTGTTTTRPPAQARRTTPPTGPAFPRESRYVRWTHQDRYFHTTNGVSSGVNYAVSVANTGTANLRCDSHVRGQPVMTSMTSTPEVANSGVWVPPGRTVEVGVIFSIRSGTGSYHVSCKRSD